MTPDLNPVTPALALAARAEALGKWIDDYLQQGAPAKYVARQAAIAAREIAALARFEDDDCTLTGLESGPAREPGGALHEAFWARSLRGRWLQ